MLFFAISLVLCVVNANGIFARSSGEFYYHGNNLSESSESVLDNHGHLENTNLEEASCKCKNGYCEKGENGSLVCICPPEFGLYGFQCDPCRCGKDSNCTFSGFLGMTTNCICKDGYKVSGSKCKGSCSPNPCKNEGVCTLKNSEIQCKCPNLYFGELCTKIDPCSSNSCKNGGTCSTTAEGDLLCTCNGTFIGKFCETDACASNPCKNNGVCGVEKDQVKCNCTTPYTGNLCQTGKCTEDSECKAKETCIDKGYCECKDGLEGKDCEVVTGCKSLKPVCDAAGLECVFEENASEKAKCNCKEENYVFVKDENECKLICREDSECGHGGTCTDGKYCKCTDGYEGKDCEVVSGCASLKPICDAAGLECIFDSKALEKAKCKCEEDNYIFIKEENACKQLCEESSDCGERGKCNDKKFCICKEGYEGDGCKVMTGCKVFEDKCEPADAICVFNESAVNKASCQCKQQNHIYDADAQQCKENVLDCGCENGGTCLFNGTCNCVEGTRGSKCEVVNCDSVDPGCKDSGGSCKFRVEDQGPFCECPLMKVFQDVSKRCEDRCEVKCGSPKGGVHCSGDQTTDETTICGCSKVTQVHIQKDKKCTDRCEVKCGKSEGVTCSGAQTTDETTICGCEKETQVYVKRDKICIDRCEINCGEGYGVTCFGAQTSDETTVCGCKSDKQIYVKKDKICIDRCAVKCGKSDGVTCSGTQTTDETTFCDCKADTQVYIEKYKKCIESCSQSGCQNGGTCSNIGICMCLPNTSGPRCETVNCNSLYAECEISGGKCKYSNRQNKLICECPPFNVFNQTSTRCEDLCQNNPCQNGGTCETSINTFFCLCKEKFFGEFCEKSWCTEICSNHSGVECDGDQTSYDRTVCGCKDKSEIYVKEVKQCINACKSNPCRNGGTCSPDGMSFRCHCEMFISGAACETDNRYLIIVFVGLALVVLVILFISNSCCILKIIQMLKYNSQNFEEW